MKLFALTIAATLGLAIPGAVASSAGAAGVERYLGSVRHDPVRLRAFLHDLPKGGDLHTSLSGAASTESLIRFAAQDNACVNTVTFAVTPGPCGPRQRPGADAVSDPAFRAAVIRAWSMEGFQTGQGESGHDHTFNVFARIGTLIGPHRPELLAETVEKAAAHNEVYLESMLNRQNGAVFGLAFGVPFDPDLGAMRDRLLAGGLADIVAAARADIDRDEARYREILRCGTPQAAKGCDVTVRYLHQAGRNDPPNVVFAFLVYGFELAKADGRYVGLNLVTAEDAPVSIRDYRLHLRMLDFLRGIYSRGHITLSAGELAAGLVPPEELTFHIREAVLAGHAERIGHGVSLRHEDDWFGLTRLLADRHIAVASPLTSNAQVLEVSGWNHPFPLYRALGVPATLATDHEGISRTDLTAEYQRAVTDYGLIYRDLKQLGRTTLEHAFIEGASLWRAPDDFRPAPPCAGDRLGSSTPSPACQNLLTSSPKAALQWRHEAELVAFERRHG